ncbi:MAG: type III-B CRISPR module RAMP protein Cmr6 [Salinibacter sp.]
MRPLYTQEPLHRADGNAGLWYDKFCEEWQPKWSEGLGDEGKQRWIDTVTDGPVGHRAQLEEAQLRRAALLRAHDQSPLFFKSAYNFVTGLGRAHPVENGFAWHHTLGVPYLPGSSVKGMVRAWAERWETWEDDAQKTDTINRIFGPKQGDLHVGSVIFLDALPTEPVQLKADVMTPHYGPYYQDESGETPPTDWHPPTPIPFLVVDDGQGFLFGVLPRRDGAQADCRRAQVWLQDALCWIGTGAKTAVGYGRFDPDPEAEQAFQAAEARRRRELEARRAEAERQAKLERQLADKSSLYAELFRASQAEDWPNDKAAFAREGLIEGWLDRLEADCQPDAIEYLSELIEHHFPGLLDDPEAKTGKKKDKFKFKERQRAFALRMLGLLEEA